MTESDWVACPTPQPLLDYLASIQAAHCSRKTLLLGCAAVRRIWPLLTHTDLREYVALVEQCAEDIACDEQVETARLKARDVFRSLRPVPPTEEGRASLEILRACLHGQATMDDVLRARAAATASYIPLLREERWPAHNWSIQYAADAAAYCRDIANTLINAAHAAAYSRSGNRADVSIFQSTLETEAAAQADLCREIFGNPFQRPRFRTDHLHDPDNRIHNLAAQIASERSFHLLPYLADLLERAGVSDQPLLLHLRQDRSHVLGCWALDFVRGFG